MLITPIFSLCFLAWVGGTACAALEHEQANALMREANIIIAEIAYATYNIRLLIGRAIIKRSGVVDFMAEDLHHYFLQYHRPEKREIDRLNKAFDGWAQKPAGIAKEWILQGLDSKLQGPDFSTNLPDLDNNPRLVPYDKWDDLRLKDVFDWTQETLNDIHPGKGKYNWEEISNYLKIIKGDTLIVLNQIDQVREWFSKQNLHWREFLLQYNKDFKNFDKVASEAKTAIEKAKPVIDRLAANIAKTYGYKDNAEILVRRVLEDNESEFEIPDEEDPSDLITGHWERDGQSHRKPEPRHKAILWYRT